MNTATATANVETPVGPCAHLQKRFDNVSSKPDGTHTCMTCGHSYNADAWTTWQLNSLRDQLQRDNAERTFIVDAGAVWCRDTARGRDFGIYSKTVTGQVVCTLDKCGMTLLHRAIPQEA